MVSVFGIEKCVCACIHWRGGSAFVRCEGGGGARQGEGVGGLQGKQLGKHWHSRGPALVGLNCKPARGGLCTVLYPPRGDSEKHGNYHLQRPCSHMVQMVLINEISQ